MVLHQSGNTLARTYTYNDVQIQGTVSGNTFIGTWTMAPNRSLPYNAGDVELYMSDDCNSFSGYWRYVSDGGWTGRWTAARVVDKSSETSATGQKSAMDWLDQGIALLNQSRFNEATQAFDRAIDIDPQSNVGGTSGGYSSKNWIYNGIVTFSNNSGESIDDAIV